MLKAPLTYLWWLQCIYTRYYKMIILLLLYSRWMNSLYACHKMENVCNYFRWQWICTYTPHWKAGFFWLWCCYTMLSMVWSSMSLHETTRSHKCIQMISLHVTNDSSEKCWNWAGGSLRAQHEKADFMLVFNSRLCPCCWFSWAFNKGMSRRWVRLQLLFLPSSF